VVSLLEKNYTLNLPSYFFIDSFPVSVSSFS
jgi:hypothetical protein